MTMSINYNRDTNGKFSKKIPAENRLVQESSASQFANRPNTGMPGVMPGGPPFMDSLLINNPLLFGMGGNWMNPMNLPGYGGLYTGTYLTYRFMLQHPVVRLVRSIDVGIIGASTWEYEKQDDKVSDEWTTLMQRMFDRLRPSLLSEYFVRGRDYGWAGGEPIWELDPNDNYYWIRRVKPLLHDVTRILQDDNGNFTGLRNSISVPGTSETHVDIAYPYKAFLYTFDGEAGYLYGRSWLENIRATAWADWLDTMQQLQKLVGKINGIITIIMSPAGKFPGPPGPDGKPTFVSYRENAERIIRDLANGAAGAWLPSLGLAPDSKGNIDATKVLLELASKSLTSFELLDFSAQVSGIGPLIERLKHDEELMFAGGLRSPRTGMEGKHGTKAEAEEHTDTGTLNAEIDDRDFAAKCQCLVDAALVVNFGEKARNRVRIKCPSLVDRKAAVLKAFMLAAMNDPILAVQNTKTADMDKIFKALGIPSFTPFNRDELDKAVKDQQKQSNQKKIKTPDPQGGRPPNE